MRSALLRRLTAVILTGLISWSVIDLMRYWVESQRIAGEARSIVADHGQTRARVLTIAGAVRARVAPADRQRPFLRSTAWETWKSGKGYCGEGARVIVVMLQSLSIPAARLYLRADRDDYFHIAVAYYDEGKWYLTDSTNSSTDLLAFLTDNRMPLDQLPGQNPFFYSYSFMNWRRVLPFMWFDQKAPLPQGVSIVMENPPLALGLTKGLLGSVGLLALGAIPRTRKKGRVPRFLGVQARLPVGSCRKVIARSAWRRPRDI